MGNLEILDKKLFLGSHVDANNEKHLKLLGVTHVLNMTAEVPNHFPDSFQYKR